RQLVTHGYIAINGRKVTIPGYMVSTGEEAGVGYYKNIDINAGTTAAERATSTKADAPVSSAETEQSATEEEEGASVA
ncbi:MAG: S4 domain-containing protein, partial [Candidatus Micrarchaeaceae archaeon]